MGRNLIYSGVFFDEKYIDLIKVLLRSYQIFNKSSSDNDYLIICNPNFQDKIQTIFDNLNLNGKIWCLDIKNHFEACWSRLKIFDYPNIHNYSKILYLDTDIIIASPLDKLFNFKMKEVIYTYDDEIKKIKDRGHGAIIFDKFKKDYDPEQLVFSTGIMLFLNGPSIKKLFNDIIGSINNLCPHNIYNLGEAYDQDFIIYHCVINKMYDIERINKYCANNQKTISPDLILNHFCFPICHPEGKLKKMTDFFSTLHIN